MAEFYTTKGISFHLENIINEAQKDIVLISPYLQTSQSLLLKLHEASNRKVKILIIYRKNKLTNHEFDALSNIRTVELMHLDRLHSKCYFNETKMIITSMNMYEYSEINNREMGILLDHQLDKEIFEKAKSEAQSIINEALSEYFGYCIRCEKEIDLDPSRPYCTNCYNVWVQFGNYCYQENVCHDCGNENYSTMKKPLCNKCYAG